MTCDTCIGCDTDAGEQDYGAVPSALIVNENTFSLAISPAAVQVWLVCACMMPIMILWHQGQPAEWAFVGDDSLQQVCASGMQPRSCAAARDDAACLRLCWPYPCASM